MNLRKDHFQKKSNINQPCEMLKSFSFLLWKKWFSSLFSSRMNCWRALHAIPEAMMNYLFEVDVQFIFILNEKQIDMTTFNGGSLGSCIDEERSKLRYVMWIAGFSESSNLWTQMALQGSPCSMSVWVSVLFTLDHSCLFVMKILRDWGLFEVLTADRLERPKRKGREREKKESLCMKV